MNPPSCPKKKSGRPSHAISAARHNFVYTSESSIQDLSNPFRRILGIVKLHHQESIHHWQSDRIFHLPLFSVPKFNGNVFTAAPVSRFIFTHSNRFGLFEALTPNPPSEMRLRKCRTFVPNLRAIQQNSSHHSIHRNSSHRSIRHHSNHQHMSVQIPECPSLPPISNFLQDLRDQLSTFCPCVSLWQFGSHFGFLWIFPCFSLFFLDSCLCLRVMAHS